MRKSTKIILPRIMAAMLAVSSIGLMTACAKNAEANVSDPMRLTDVTVGQGTGKAESSQGTEQSSQQQSAQPAAPSGGGLVTGDDGKSYYYNGDGELEKDGIVGNDADGYYYADADGVIDMGYCNGVTVDGQDWNVIEGKATKADSDADKALFGAVKAVGECTDSSMTREEKLRACFDHLKTAYLEGVRHDPPYNEMDWPVLYCNDIFVYGMGDCFSYGAAFAYMAKGIGYTECYACNTGGHGWAEVNGLYYDPEWDMHHNEYNHFGVAADDPCDVDYSGTLTEGVDWMRVKV